MSFKSVFIFIFFLSAFASCSGKKEPLHQERILVSVAPYIEIVGRIAGEGFSVLSAVPPSSSPHSYEPTSKEIFSMSKSSVWFQIQEPFERKISPTLLEKNEDLWLVDLQEGVHLLEGSSCCQGEIDRHIWMSPKGLSTQAKIIQETLARRYPDKKDLFEKNLRLLLQDLLLLDQEIQEKLTGLNQKSLLVSHPAFAYFCEEFGLRQLSVEQEGKDPRPKHLSDLLSQIEEERPLAVLLLPQYNNKGAQLIAQKKELPTVLIDPYSPHYFEMMQKLANAIQSPYETH